MTGFVYCIGEAPGGHVKVGYTSDLRKRLAAFQTASPVKLALLGAIPGDQRLERVMHERFADLHVIGEWFTDVNERISSQFPAQVVEAVEVVDLRTWLEANGVTQGAFAKHIGVSQQSISRIVAGIDGPRASTAWLIECATGGAIPMQFWGRDIPAVEPMVAPTVSA